MIVYRVREWSLRFENDRSRVRDRCGFVCLPNKNGVGKQIILREPDGTAIFGFFALICEELSKQRRPREGWLTHGGAASGLPWSDAELQIMTGATPQFQKRAFEVLIRQEINWMEKHGESMGSGLPSDSPGKEGKGREGNSDLADARSGATAPDLKGIAEEKGINDMAKKPTPYDDLAPALRAKGFDPKAIARACQMVKRTHGDQVKVLAAMLEGVGATDPVSYAAAILRDGCPAEHFLEEAARLLTPAPAAEPGLAAELDAVGKPEGARP